MAVILRGDIQSVLIQGKVASTWSPTNGATTTYTFNGVQSLAVSYALTLQQQGWQTQLEQGPVWTLTATYPEDLLTGNPSFPPVIWTIEPHAVERSVLECNDRDFIASLSMETKNRIEYKLKNPQSTIKLTSDKETSQFANASAAYNLMRLGVEARQEWTIAVKRSLVVSRYATNSNWVLNNNGYVLSKATLASYGIDTATYNFLPESTGVQTDANGISFAFGYLEQKPTRQTLPNQKVALEQLWIYNKWSCGSQGLYNLI